MHKRGTCQTRWQRWADRLTAPDCVVGSPPASLGGLGLHQLWLWQLQWRRRWMWQIQSSAPKCESTANQIQQFEIGTDQVHDKTVKINRETEIWNFKPVPTESPSKAIWNCFRPFCDQISNFNARNETSTGGGVCFHQDLVSQLSQDLTVFRVAQCLHHPSLTHRLVNEYSFVPVSSVVGLKCQGDEPI